MGENKRVFHKKNILGWILVLLCLLVIGAANYITVFVTDDLWYKTNLVTGEPLSGVRDIIQSQIWHYNNWGGRAVAHTLLQLLLWGGRVFSDVCNVICCIALCLCMCWYSKKLDFRIFLLAIGILFGINPQWFDTMLWQSGAANYLYMTTIMLCFALIYISHAEGDIHASSVAGYSILMVPLGLLAGWSNENMGPAMFLLAVVVMIGRMRKHLKVPIWMWIGSITSLLGSIAMLIAPGNSVRYSETAKPVYDSFTSWIWQKFLDRYEVIGVPTFDYMWRIIALLLFCLLLYKACKIQLELCDKLILFTAILSYLAMWVTPHYPARATFGTLVLIGCVVCRCFRRIYEQRADMGRYLLLVTGYIDLTVVYTLALYVFQMKKWI